MHSFRLMPALCALAIIMMTGCKQPAGVPSDVHTATTHTLYITTDGVMAPCGRINWYQGWDEELQKVWEWYTYTNGTIKRAFNYYQPPLDTNCAYPRSNGHCVFKIPGFLSMGGTPACTLFYYQTAHSGSAGLAVTAWWEVIRWPPVYEEDQQTAFWAEWNSTDTVATDSTRATDNCWYAIPLSNWAIGAIVDSGATYYGTENYAFFYTGWVYPTYMANHGEDGWYTDVSGSSGYAPYIKVVYED